MRRSLVGAVTTVLAAATAVVAVQFTIAPSTDAAAAAAAAEPYTWKNVRIDGGGFVPGIVFNQTEKNLIYARTDIGGAYRWDQASQTLDPAARLGRAGTTGATTACVSLATDPVQTNRVYAAVGMYTNDWDPNNGAILRSADQGATWQATALPFKLGGNMPGRGMGERLAIDPNTNSVLYFGAPERQRAVAQHRLRRDLGQGDQLPQRRQLRRRTPPTPTATTSDNQGVVWVTFDKRTGTAGNATQTIYVGVADKDNTVYRSTDGGATWAARRRAADRLHRRTRACSTRSTATCTSPPATPAARTTAARATCGSSTPATGAWTQISPIPSSQRRRLLRLQRPDHRPAAPGHAHGGHPDLLVAGRDFFRSTDGGATWTRIWDFGQLPERSPRYTMDISAAPWLTFGANPAPPEDDAQAGLDDRVAWRSTRSTPTA